MEVSQSLLSHRDRVESPCGDELHIVQVLLLNQGWRVEILLPAVTMSSFTYSCILKQAKLAKLVAATSHDTSIAHQENCVNLSACNLPDHGLLPE